MQRMLIIDDDIEACETIESLITRLSHECDMAHTISSGKQLLGNQGYDVVFLDVGLPDGNGLDLLPEIMQLSNAPEVIILTGKGDAAERSGPAAPRRCPRPCAVLEESRA